MATIVDVAKCAGVSPSLVSRYLNNVPGVSAKNREKIKQAIDQCGYRRNELARSLVQLKTKAIGVIIDALETTFFGPLINGIVLTAEASDYTVLFSTTRNKMELKDRAIKYFTHKMVDGIIVYGSNMMDRRIIDEISNIGFPLVLIENDEPAVNVDKVLVNSREALYRATRYLIEGGLRDIRYIPWGHGLRAGHDRQDGFIEAMREAGLFSSERSICLGGVDHEDPSLETIEGLLSLLQHNHDLPEAFVCGADIKAADVLMAARRLGISIPNELSVTGFDGDDLLLSYYGYPELMTMSQPLYEMGAKAVELMLDIFNTPNRKIQNVLFSTDMVLGETVKLKR